MGTFLCLAAVVLIIAAGIWQANVNAKAHAANPGKIAPSGRAYNQALTCPHCNVQGRITTEQVKNKKGISGGKATGALLTGGASLLVTGLSRKEGATKLHCYNCTMIWHV